MSYAYILGMAPFGILSAGFLTPLLQLLPRVRHSEQVGLLLHRLPTLLWLLVPTAASVTVLAPHIVTLAFSGGAFQTPEVSAVAALLPYVQLSASLGLLRDVLVRMHYVRGNGWLMLSLQLGLLGMNACMNAAVLALGGGAAGIIGTSAMASGVGMLLSWWLLQCRAEESRRVWQLLQGLLVTVAATALSVGFAVWCMGGVPPVTDRWSALKTCSEFGAWMVLAYGVCMGLTLLLSSTGLRAAL